MLTGKLDTLSVTEVLTLLSRSRSSGALRITGPEEGVVYCVEGDVTVAASYPGDRLADVLVGPGLLSAVDWQSATGADDQGATLTATVTAHGIDEARLQGFLRLQAEETIFELSQWTEGEFGFVGGQTHPLSGLASFPVTELLESLVHRMERWPQLTAALGGLDDPVLPVGLLPSDEHVLSLTAAQLQVVRLVDGTRSVRQLARARGDGLFHTTELVVSLVEAGYVRFEGAAPTASAVARATAPAPASRRKAAEPKPEPKPEPKAEKPAPKPEPAPVDVTTPTRAPAATKPSTNGKSRSPAKAAAALADEVGASDKPDRGLVLRLLAAVKELEVPEGGVK